MRASLKFTTRSGVHVELHALPVSRDCPKCGTLSAVCLGHDHVAGYEAARCCLCETVFARSIRSTRITNAPGWVVEYEREPSVWQRVVQWWRSL